MTASLCIFIICIIYQIYCQDEDFSKKKTMYSGLIANN